MGSRQVVVASGLVGAGPAVGFAQSWPLSIGLFLASFVVALVIGLIVFARRPGGGRPAEVPQVREELSKKEPREEPEEVQEAAPVVPVVAREPAAAPAVEDRVARLQAALESGRLSREAYEANLRKLGREPEPAAAAPPMPAPGEAQTVDERIARLRAAYEAGRLPREAYQENLRRIREARGQGPPVAVEAPGISKAFERAFESSRAPPGPAAPPVPSEAVNPPPEPVMETPLANPPPASPEMPPDVRERVDRLAQSLAEGRLTREAHERALARVYEAVEPRLLQLRKALEAGRIPTSVYDANVRRLLQERAAP